MPTRLSVCLLTRDDERQIERAIRSVDGVADEVVVAETGSTDRTAAVAAGAGARVVPIAWDDDFAAGRDLAVGQATGDWVLWLNPDEELEPPGADRVRALIDGDGGPAFGYLARIFHQSRADRPLELAETWDLRLFRRRDDLRHVGRLHPTLDPAFLEAVAAEGGRVEPSDLVLRRHAYESTLDPSKLRWALRLIEKELADRPDRLHYRIERGRNLLLLGDPEGHEVMAEALGVVADAAGAPTAPSPEVQLLLEYVLTTPADRYRGPVPVDLAASLALRWFPDSPPLLWALASLYAQSGRAPAAVVLLERLLRLGAEGSFDRSEPFDPRIMGPLATINLGRCYRATGRPEAARRCFERLIGDPDLGDEAAALLADAGRT